MPWLIYRPLKFRTRLQPDLVPLYVLFIGSLHVSIIDCQHCVLLSATAILFCRCICVSPCFICMYLWEVCMAWDLILFPAAIRAAHMVGYLTPSGITVSDRQVYLCTILLVFVFVICIISEKSDPISCCQASCSDGWTPHTSWHHGVRSASVFLYNFACICIRNSYESLGSLILFPAARLLRLLRWSDTSHLAASRCQIGKCIFVQFCLYLYS